MESFLGIKHKDTQLLNLLRQRENYESVAGTLPQKLRVIDTFISRLGLEKELDGHKGCVNCLEWNESGEILASGSDDMHVILWDPFRYKKKIIFPTGHNGNIFSVKFMPKTNDTLVVTGAGDGGVRIHDMQLSKTILICDCHKYRVKRVATAPTIPFIFWTAAEDGFIFQYDIRAPHNCKSDDRKNVLVDLVNHAGRKAEAKCIAVNAVKPELIAIGSNDPYVRMYDRRMIKFGQVPMLQSECSTVHTSPTGRGDPINNIPLGCAQYFVAGHLQSSYSRGNNRYFTTTYLTFSTDGSELLVNTGGEQIYLFDIDKNKNTKILQNNLNNYTTDTSLKHSDSPDDSEDIRKLAYGNNFISNLESLNMKELPQNIEQLKQEADANFREEHYTHAINLYNNAINLCPYAAVLYANRAATLMKRRWNGDIYSALRDCQITLQLDVNNVKAHFRLARCLYDLNRATEACRVIDDFQNKFPTYSSNSSYRALRKDIMEAIKTDPELSQSQMYPVQISSLEGEWRQNIIDYKLRLCGHCNTTTDIKEANYFGDDDQYIVAGSDDGSFFIWDRFTTNIVRVLRGDSRVVNCLQPHPSTCLLATGGIDPVIRLWSPLPEDGTVNERVIEDLHEAASANQIRMNSNPFKMMMINMGYQLRDDDDESNESPFIQPASCRPS